VELKDTGSEEAMMGNVLSDKERALMDAYWRAANYKEEGTTTTPFDVCVLNDLDRVHLVSEVIDRVPKLGPRAAYGKPAIRHKLIEHRQYICWYGDDMPEIADCRRGQEVASTGCVPQSRTMSDPPRLRR
jgi:phosphoketolase